MLKTINIDNELKFYDTNLDHHHHLYNTTMSTLTDIDNDKVVFAELPEIPKNLQIESTEVLIKARNKQSQLDLKSCSRLFLTEPSMLIIS